MRAVAVIAVVLYHAWPGWLPGGFVGVDIFFVISGFLITSLLLAQLARGTFSLTGFYLRRMRRIFPALIIVLAATLALGWTVLLGAEFLQLGRHALAGAGFSANLLLWYEAGYFDNAASTKPLLHLWSLGVEEQYYLVWPLLLWAAWARARSLTWLLPVLFALSFAANILLVDTDPVAAFFSPLTRFWELMAGAGAAWLQRHRQPWPATAANGCALAGLLLLALAFALITPQSRFPGWWALLPVGGTFLLLLAGPDARVNRLLGWRPAAFMGLISYPLYLWHWPLLVFATILHGQKPPWPLKVLLLFMALGLAWLTWRIVELPLRARPARGKPAWSLAAGMAACAVAGLAAGTGLLRERIDTTAAAPYLAALNDTQFPGPGLVPVRHDGIVFQQVSSQAPGLTVFVGDSVMEQYGPRITHAIAADPGRFSSALFATAGGCPPIANTIRLPRLRFPLCPRSVAAAYALAADVHVHTVVVGAAWDGYFNAGQRELVYDDGRVRAAFPDPQAQDLAWRALRTSLARLRAQGKRVFLILQPPAGPAFDPHNMVRGSRLGKIEPVSPIMSFNLVDYQARNALTRTRLAALASAVGATLIDPAAHLCLRATCPVIDAMGTPLYTDSVHMRPSYSRRAATFLDQTLVKPSPP